MSYIIYQNNLSIHWYIKATCRTYIKTTYHMWYSKTTCLVYILKLLVIFTPKPHIVFIYLSKQLVIHLYQNDWSYIWNIKKTCHTFIYENDLSYVFIIKQPTYVFFFFYTACQTFIIISKWLFIQTSDNVLCILINLLI